MTQTNVLDPVNWLESLHRTLEEYVKTGINNSIKDNTNTPAGLRAYDVTFDFPAADEIPGEIPFRNSNGEPITLLHFIIDDIENRRLGHGDGVVSETFESQVGLIFPNEAEGHLVNFDVGVWSTDASGGTTARLRAYQLLNSLFGGPTAKLNFQKVTNGITIKSWSGGRMIQDKVNDIVVYRVIDCTLETHVFSKVIVGYTEVTDFVQTPGIYIEDQLIVDV